MSNLIIRGVEQTEEAEWRRLWAGYLEFYDSSVDEAVYPSTFGRFFSEDPYDPRCFVAELDGALVGLVHFFQHRHAWRLENVVYLQDLFADPKARGEGVGRKLIEAVYAQADNWGCPQVYWTTQTFNETARRLYDRIGVATDFMKYQRPPKA